MSRLTIRHATASDTASFLDLVDQLAAYEKLPPPDAAARNRLVTDAFGPDPRFDVMLGWLDGEAVGYALYFESYSSFLARPTLYLEDLFVVPAARGQRVGSALFRRVAGEAVARGCGRMEWAVLTWNQLAIDFYRRLDAEALDGWRTYRLSGAQLVACASSAGPSSSPGS